MNKEYTETDSQIFLLKQELKEFAEKLTAAKELLDTMSIGEIRAATGLPEDIIKNNMDIIFDALNN